MKTLALLLVLLLSACVDRGECLVSHTETWLQPIYMTVCNGSNCTQQLIGMQPMTDEVCDRWQYPNGRPKS